MFKKILILAVSIIFVFIIIQKTLPLRFFNYDVYPVPNLDEYNYVWQALSLKKTGLPMAWTLNTGEYQNPKYNPKIGEIKGLSINSINLFQFKTQKNPLTAVKELDYGKGIEQISFVAPFFDHPPLGGLIYQLGVPKNINSLEQVKPADFRKPAIVLSIITTILLFVLLYLIFKNPLVPLLSVVIYSTVSTYILATRTTYLENAIPPFILLSLIFLYLSISFKSKLRSGWIYFFIILSGLIGGLSVLVKEPAIGFFLGFFILLIVNKLPKKIIFSFVISTILPILVYVGWGLWLQKDLFLGIFFTNVSRDYFGAIKMVTQLEALKFKNFPVDGWWIWGLISFLIISLKKSKKIIFITLPLLTHFLTILFLPSPNYPWYLISCIPFFAAASAIFIWQIAQKPNWGSALAFFFIPFSSSYYWGRAALSLSPSINHYRYLFFIFILFLFFRLKFKQFKITQYLWFLFVGFLIYRIFIYNQVFFPYLMAHWGNLPVPSLPNF